MLQLRRLRLAALGPVTGEGIEIPPLEVLKTWSENG